jgi:hypothetical protein
MVSSGAVTDMSRPIYPYPIPTTAQLSVANQHFHSLSERNHIFLQSLTLWAAANDIKIGRDLCVEGGNLHDSLTLLRYLRANKFDLENTMHHIEENIETRRERKLHELLAQTPDDILGVSIDDVLAVFPHWHLNYDVSGRPVIYKVTIHNSPLSSRFLFSFPLSNLGSSHLISSPFSSIIS